MIFKILIFGILLGGSLFLKELIKTKIETMIEEQEEDHEEEVSNYNQNKYNDLLQNGQYSYNAPKVWHPYSSFNDNIEGIKAAEKAASIKVLDMPQFTFDQWLTFYQNKPEVWVIDKVETRTFSDIPYYVREIEHEDTKHTTKIKNTVYLPVFWESAQEMVKYRNWVETEYEQGRAAIFDQAREENLKKLTKYLREDINESREKTHKEFEEYQKQIEQQQKKNNMILRLSTGEEVKVPDIQTGIEYPQFDKNEICTIGTIRYGLPTQVFTGTKWVEIQQN